MNKLSPEQQQLILDFYFRCGEQKDIDEGRDLIASNPGAAELYSRLEDTLTETLGQSYEPCPDNLVELTLARLRQAALTDTPNTNITELLKKEQEFKPEPIAAKGRLDLLRTRYFRPMFEAFAAAAAILIVSGMLFPSFSLMRQHSRQVACSRNLGQVGAAFAGMMNDQGNDVSQMKIKDGAPWWKIGYDGPETQSNTRYVWQLVKQGYVPAEAFVCKGRNGAVPVQLTKEQLAQLQDFPSRCNVSYSFVICNEGTFRPGESRKVLAGDLNPVFEKIPCQQNIYLKLNEFEKVLLNEQLRQMMSGNHASRGQNILFTDGSVQFVRTRLVNGDDIFTINGVDSYTGRETPSDTRDTFLAP
ncbi:MAG: hypothetical protein LLF76_05650 [Planctomycetaceae bacterium]|nr:hypothetical protein [Planctomycetaceae bacterium]